MMLIGELFIGMPGMCMRYSVMSFYVFKIVKTPKLVHQKECQKL